MIDPVSLGIIIGVAAVLLIVIGALTCYFRYKRYKSELYDELRSNMDNDQPIFESTHKNVKNKTLNKEPYTFKLFWKDLKTAIKQYITLEKENKTQLKTTLAGLIDEKGFATTDYEVSHLLGNTKTGQQVTFFPVLNKGCRVRKPEVITLPVIKTDSPDDNNKASTQILIGVRTSEGI